MVVTQMMVEIIGNRIMNKGINPKTQQVYVIEDVTNEEYREAVEKYILDKTSDA